MKATLVLVLCVLFDLSFGYSQFTIQAQDDWALQPWFNNEPYNHVPGVGADKNLFTVGDGLFSYP